MQLKARSAVLAAILVFLLLFAFRLAFAPQAPGHDAGGFFQQQSVAMARKNYASANLSAGPHTGDSQKYEKVATLTELTDDFEADRKRVDSLVAAHAGIVQLESATGLAGRRTRYLGIGVPPDRFDAFITAITAVGRSAQVEIVKIDRTNEYLQLRAKRTTLEKALAGVEAIKTAGGSVVERLNAQNRQTEIEQQLQDLAVSLGEFDAQNELCTVKLTLREVPAAAPRAWSARITDALVWTSIRYALLGAGFLCLVIGGWLAVPLAKAVRRLATTPAA
jgi:Domain of unknown function (DUF4349)